MYHAPQAIDAKNKGYPESSVEIVVTIQKIRKSGKSLKACPPSPAGEEFRRREQGVDFNGAEAGGFRVFRIG